MATMKILILFAVLGFLVVEGEVFQQKLIRVESRKTKMIKDGTWDEYYKNKQLVQQSFDASDVSQNMNDFDELEYVGDISIGNPPQTFKVHYSLTTMRFWINDISCGNISSAYSRCPLICSKPGGSSFCYPSCIQNGTGATTVTLQQICDQKSKFDSSKSTTFSSDPNSPSYDYYDFEFGSVTSLPWAKDNITIQTESGNLKGSSVPFSQLIEMSPVFADTPFDGIFGLQPIDAIFSKVNFEKRVFTIYLQDTENEYDVPGGYITFGGVDEEHCSSEVAYFPDSEAPINVFTAHNITYGSVICQGMDRIKLDTSRTSIYGPDEYVQQFKTAAGASDNGKIDCDAKIEDFNIKIGSDDAVTTLTIPAKNFLIQNADGTCNIAFESMPPSKIGYNEWIFGTPWFRSYCTIFPFVRSMEKLGYAQIIA